MHWFMNTAGTDLSTPPPVTGMHLVVDTLRLGLVKIVPFGGKDKCSCEFWVSKDRADACNNVTEVDIESLATDNDLLSDEWWTSWQMVVDDFIELYCSLV